MVEALKVSCVLEPGEKHKELNKEDYIVKFDDK